MTILVIGDLIIDEYWKGSSTRLSPEAPVPVISGVSRSIRLGGAANVAMNIHSMGSPVRLMSQAGPELDRHLLGDLPYQLIKSTSTPRKIRIIANNQVICRVDDESFQGVIPSRSWIDPKDSICVLSDYNKGFLHGCTDLIKHCAELGIKTLVDPKQDWRIYHGAWLIKANRSELESQISRSFDIEDLPRICSELSWELGISNMVITLGDQGLYSWSPAKGMHMPAPKRQVVDVTGAGDVVVAALAHYLCQGFDLHQAAHQANILASLSVSKQGSYVITKDDLESVSEKVVFTNGCFDILHVGHLDYLKRSRALGTKLVVGLNSDSSVKQLKGTDRPFNDQYHRKAMLESLEFVDEVVIFDEPTPRELILKFKPDIITKGGDYTPDQVVGNDLVNQVVIIPLTPGYSTTKILERMR
jgi:D-beta-D-heptose 7-phosphate kinase/D-beta-D-heptose 1-phosphate adenosyltransferase